MSARRAARPAAGVSRAQFLRRTGVGAAGLAGAAMMGSGVAHAYGETIPVGFLFEGALGNEQDPSVTPTVEHTPTWQWAAKVGFDMAMAELKKTLPVQEYEWNVKTPGNTVVGYTQDLVNTGVVFISSGLGSGNTETAAPVARNNEVIMGASCASSDYLSNCTPEIIQEGFRPSNLPSGTEPICWNKNDGYLYRTHSRGTDWGAAVADYANMDADYSQLTTAALMLQATGFGETFGDGFANAWMEDGKSVLATVSYPGTPTVESFKTLIPGLLVNGAPQVVVGCWTQGALMNFLEAWYQLYPGMNQPMFLHGGSVRGDYSGLSPGALSLLKDYSIGIQPHFDPTTPGYQAWFNEFLAYDPKHVHWQNGPRKNNDQILIMDRDGNPLFRHSLATYDAVVIYFLARAKAEYEDGTTANSVVKEKIISVTNPPGVEVYPGQFAYARDLIMQGQEIDYQGAGSYCDLNEAGNIAELPWLPWTVDAAGQPVDGAVF